MSTPAALARTPQFHEDLHRTETKPAPSNRAFGLTVGPILVLLSLRPLLAHRTPWWGLTAAGAALLLVALVVPKTLGPLNRAWMALGDLLGRLIGPVMLGMIFYLVVTPTGWLLRLRGADSMRRRMDPSRASYWQPRQPSGPAPETMSNQF